MNDDELYVNLEDAMKGTLTESEEDVNESLNIYDDYDGLEDGNEEVL